MTVRLQDNKITETKERTPTVSRIVTVNSITTMMFLVLVSSASPSSSLFLQPQQAEATAYGLELQRGVPLAYIVIDGKASRL